LNFNTYSLGPGASLELRAIVSSEALELIGKRSLHAHAHVVSSRSVANPRGVFFTVWVLLALASVDAIGGLHAGEIITALLTVAVYSGVCLQGIDCTGLHGIKI
jgi:hypothetical protein